MSASLSGAGRRAARRALPLWAAALALLVLLALPAMRAGAGEAAGPEPFDRAELERFVAQAPGFFRWAQGHGLEQIIQDVVRDPASIGHNPLAPAKLRELGWRPERFAYLLNHAVKGHWLLDMGGRPEKHLEYMREQRAKTAHAPGLSPAQREQALAELDRSIRNLEGYMQTLAELPRAELALMWMKRDELLALFRVFQPYQAAVTERR